MKTPKIDNVEILGLTIVLYGETDNSPSVVDLGAVTIKREEREYILDVVQSYSTPKDGFTTIETDLERDDEIFDECPYDITAEDLMSNDLVVEFYIASEFPIENMTLFVRFGGENGMTKAINVVED
jgi:hypothetical protein